MCVALYDYDERFRSAREEAEATERDVVIVEIERGLLEPAELAMLVSFAELKPGEEFAERAEAARSVLARGRDPRR